MKTRREWVELCKITQPELGQAWEEELNNNPDAKWDSIFPNMGTCLRVTTGFWWVDSIKGESYWTKIHRDMLNNPSKYETLPQKEQPINVETKGGYYVLTCPDGHGLPLHKVISQTNGFAVIETNDYLFAVRECNKLNNVLYPSPPVPSEPTKINRTLIEIFRELKEGRSERSQKYLQKLIDELEMWDSGL